jgi:peptidoglycan/LPS O-acetylase OafA/YrhL
MGYDVAPATTVSDEPRAVAAPSDTSEDRRDARLAAAHADYLGHKYFASLDGLRCLAISGVMAAHAYMTWLNIEDWGRQGVALFFVISGFLITSLLLRERERDGTISIKNFYLRRALRIFPLYYAVLALYVVVVLVMEGLHHPQGRMFFRNLPYFLTYTGNWFMDTSLPQTHFFHSWSLCVEEQFYFVWPFVIWFAGRRTIVPVLVMSTVMVLMFIVQPMVEAKTISFGWFGDNVVTYISTAICMGSLLAYALHFRKTFNWCYPVLGQNWSCIAFFVLAGVLIYFREFVPVYFLYLAMAGIVGSACIRDRHPLRPLLANKFVIYIGTISYGMYMMNQLCKHGTPRKIHDYNQFLFFFASAGLTVLVASISYYVYERPFLRLKDKFRRVEAKPD